MAYLRQSEQSQSGYGRLRIWTKRPYFEKNPQEAIRILSKCKTDESEYVRKSVGNALKDISKQFPELIQKELKTWDLGVKEICNWASALAFAEIIV